MDVTPPPHKVFLGVASVTLSAYHLYGKPGNSGENSNGTVHPGGNFSGGR